MDPSSTMNSDVRPFMAIWEVSRACDLACLPCRAAAQPRRSALELSTYEGYELIEQVAELRPMGFAFSGGDPLKRPDIYELIDFARRRGLSPSVAPSPTPLLTAEAIEMMKTAGVARLSLGIDGATPESHDGARGIPGAFRHTVDAIRHAKRISLPVQVNTTLSRINVEELERIASLVGELGVVSWNVSFLVPLGLAKADDMLTAEEVEEAFGNLYEIGRGAAFEIRTGEALHYRRFVAQRKLLDDPELMARVFAGGKYNSGELVASMKQAVVPGGGQVRGIVFVSHIGEVYPSGFLPLSAGNIRFRRLSTIFRASPLFATLRDSAQLKGKCGMCEFRDLCGGSRARAYAVTGDPMAAEPLCAHQPADYVAPTGDSGASRLPAGA